VWWQAILGALARFCAGAGPTLPDCLTRRTSVGLSERGSTLSRASRIA
jgi:hypothetical protein